MMHMQVTWSKPLLLGKEELRPFLTRDQAAFKIQQLHRSWKARETVRDAMRAEWSRVYSPQVRHVFGLFWEGGIYFILFIFITPYYFYCYYFLYAFQGTK